MLAKDLIAELQKLPPDTDVMMMDPRGAWTSDLFARHYSDISTVHIEGMPCSCAYYMVHYGDNCELYERFPDQFNSLSLEMKKHESK